MNTALQLKNLLEIFIKYLYCDHKALSFLSFLESILFSLLLLVCVVNYIVYYIGVCAINRHKARATDVAATWIGD